MEIVAIVLARGGSKGLPGKNLRTVGGVSLVERAIRSASSIQSISRVIVSTDDAAISAEARGAGAEVLERPTHLATDRATSESALLHALDLLHPTPRVVVFIQPTSPFIDTVALEDAIARVSSGAEDVVFSAIETFAFLWQIDEDGASAVNHDATHRPRRQDRTAHYAETGAFYVMNVVGFQASRHRFFGRIGLAIVGERTAIEIDNVEQLAIADVLAVGFDVPSEDSPSRTTERRPQHI